MPLDPYLGAVLRRLHAEFIQGKTPRSRAIGPAAKALGILPITDDWNWDLGIRLEDGAVIAFYRAPPHEAHEEPLSRRLLGILNQARWIHPELRGLIPPRPTDARDCEFCGGRGERTGREDGILRACPHCAAGWVPFELADDYKR